MHTRVENVDKYGMLDVVINLVNEIILETKYFAKHLFTTSWQHTQFIC